MSNHDDDEKIILYADRLPMVGDPSTAHCTTREAQDVVIYKHMMAEKRKAKRGKKGGAQ